jgi:hypothetical protein
MKENKEKCASARKRQFSISNRPSDMDDCRISIPEITRPSLRDFVSNFVSWNQLSNIQRFICFISKFFPRSRKCNLHILINFLAYKKGHIAPLCTIYQSRMSVLRSQYAPMVSESCIQNLQSPVCVQLWSTSSTSRKTVFWILLLLRKLFSTHPNRGFGLFEFRIQFESFSILKKGHIATSAIRLWPFFYHQIFFDQITVQWNMFFLPECPFLGLFSPIWWPYPGNCTRIYTENNDLTKRVRGIAL